jgi:hypothetical protein
MFKQVFLFLFLFLFESKIGFSQPLIHKKVIVNLHLEKFNKYYNLYHIGISFKDENENKIIRYDYRPFCEDKSLNTNQLVIIDKFYKLLLSKTIENITIFWGETNKTFEEIEAFEKTLQKKYILGIHDCRHYVNSFSLWSLNKKTPIWKLHKFYKNRFSN